MAYPSLSFCTAPRARAAATLLCTILAGCFPEEGTGSGTDTTGAPETGDAAASTTGDASTTGAPTTSTGEPATTDATTGSSTGDTDEGEDTGEPAGYCWGFHVNAPEPYLELHDKIGEQLAEGVPLPLECGGQGLWMFGLYPKFGGWDPMKKSVEFAVTVDVEGFNTSPSGHFYKSSVGYSLSCANGFGDVPGVVPIFPPDELADLSLLDGLPAHVHVEIAAAGELLVFDATLPLSAPKGVVDEGCIFSP